MSTKVSGAAAVGLLALAAAACLQGCAVGLGKSVHQYVLTETETPKGRQKVRSIEAEADQLVLLGFTDNTDFADQARERLLEKCPKGRIVGISAKHSTDLGFMAYRNRMRLTGLCVE
jgi:hypothetical protein